MATFSTGEDIATIQGELNDLGYGPLVTNGTVSPSTTAAIRRFQGDYGVQASGTWDPASSAAMTKAYAEYKAGLASAQASPPQGGTNLSDADAQKAADSTGHAVQAKSGVWFMPTTIFTNTPGGVTTTVPTPTATKAPAGTNWAMWAIGAVAVAAGVGLVAMQGKKGHVAASHALGGRAAHRLLPHVRRTEHGAVSHKEHAHR